MSSATVSSSSHGHPNPLPEDDLYSLPDGPMHGVPLIYLAQKRQQRPAHELGAPEYDDDSDQDSISHSSGTQRPLKKALSTISEKTERTEASPFWGNAGFFPSASPHPRSSVAPALEDIRERFQSFRSPSILMVIKHNPRKNPVRLRSLWIPT